jgi:hypothetical protein
LFEVDAKRQRSRLVPLLQIYPGEDVVVSSHGAGISSDFTPIGSIRKLEVLCSVDLYTDKRCQKPV